MGKGSLFAATALGLGLLGGPVLAQDAAGDRPVVGTADRADRVERRFDRQGDVIDRRFDRAATRADMADHDRLANRFDRRGDVIDRQLDRRGRQADRRMDRRIDRGGRPRI